MTFRHSASISVWNWIGALCVAILILLFISSRTNLILPKFDAEYYMDMAKNGLWNNPKLVAPFAYRPALPFLVNRLHVITGISVDRSFRICGALFGIGLLMSVYLLVRSSVPSCGHRNSLLVMLISGLGFAHLKLPLAFYGLVDIAAYPLAVLAFWALVSRRLSLCLVLVTIGLFFKEFLAIPWIILIVYSMLQYKDTHASRHLTFGLLALLIGLLAILVPRLTLPIAGTLQSIDPLNNLASLLFLVKAVVDEGRLFNIFYGLLSYCLPILILLSPGRLGSLLADLRQRGDLSVVSLYFVLNMLLVTWGGKNIAIFISYLIPVQALILALILGRGVPAWEKAYLVFAVFVYNKIAIPIPLPIENFDEYIDFYGVWHNRVEISSVVRLFLCLFLIATPALIRLLEKRYFSRSVV